MPSSSARISRVIAASSAGTLIEWYDFYIFGSLSPILAKKFFPEDQSAAALLSTLAIFAAGFIVRPFGALVFGRLGDKTGRKNTFLLTLVLMGGSTFAIGLIPGYASIGYAAPLLVLFLRLVQGLALGGEYGGAATYVAEHAPDSKRGLYTSWIQTTATLGLFLSLAVILLTRSSLAPSAAASIQQFEDWGWRIPFWFSILLVAVSVYIRLKMKESPLFDRLKKSGGLSSNPLKESFSRKANMKWVLLALFGAVMGQGVVWYTGQFYAQNFIETVCKVDFEQTRTILLWAIALGTPFFILFGWLSDKWGRKWIMLSAMLMAVLFYRPLYQRILQLTAVEGKTETGRALLQQSRVPVNDTVFALQRQFSVQYHDGTTALASVADTLTVLPFGEAIRGGRTSITAKRLPPPVYRQLILLVFIQIIWVTMVYGPIAAFLVELFPTHIRYTSMSLPYHIGNGVFGGLVPFIGTLIVELSKTPEAPAGSPLAGLWYPVTVAAICFIIGALYLPARNNRIQEAYEQD